MSFIAVNAVLDLRRRLRRFFVRRLSGALAPGGRSGAAIWPAAPEFNAWPDGDPAPPPCCGWLRCAPAAGAFAPGSGSFTSQFLPGAQGGTAAQALSISFVAEKLSGMAAFARKFPRCALDDRAVLRILGVCTDRHLDYRDRAAGQRAAPAQRAARLLGNSLTVEQRTLTPSVLVRIQVPQPAFLFL